MGAANATVLPEPVLEPPMQSRPAKIAGIQAFWMRVGRVMAMCERDVVSHGSVPRVAKLALSPCSVEARMESGAFWVLIVSFSGGALTAVFDLILEVELQACRS